MVQAPFFIVARGPVPRDRWIPRTLARDRPSPYGEGWRFFYRRAGACPPRSFMHRYFFVARGPVPRDRSVARGMARDRPSPYGEGGVFFRSAGALGCQTRIRAGFPRERWFARGMNAGEGQALALRCGTGVFFRKRDMKHPQLSFCQLAIRTMEML